MNSSFGSRHSGISAGGVLLLLVVVVLIVFLSLPHWRDHPVRGPHVRQKAQFHSIEAALELFAREFQGCPPSEANDVTGLPYCGAMKLAEAMMGRDLMGFHPKSAYRADGLDPNTRALLYAGQTLHARPSGGYLPLENANAYRLVDIYGKGRTGPFPEDAVVLCDTFVRKLPNGKKAGMPILYYRANPIGTKHDANNPDDPQNIYSYKDNLALLALGLPGSPKGVQPLANPRRFYLNTQNTKVSIMQRPYRSDSFILVSAGYDRLYGTADDICNFEWRYRGDGDAGPAQK